MSKNAFEVCKALAALYDADVPFKDTRWILALQDTCYIKQPVEIKSDKVCAYCLLVGNRQACGASRQRVRDMGSKEVTPDQCFIGKKLLEIK